MSSTKLSLNQNLILKDTHNIQRQLLLIKSYKEISLLTHNKIQKYSLPIPFNYDYKIAIDSPEIDIDSGQHIKKSDNPPLKFQKLFNNILQSTYSVFTDASKNKTSDYTGLAFFVPSSDIKKQFKTSPQASIFTTEALAIILAIHHIKSIEKTAATIFTDSLSILKAIKCFNPIKSKNTSHLIMDIKSLLYSCKQQNIKITLVWVPAHINIKPNETVDLLAKEAINKGINLISLLPHTDFLEEIKATNKNNELQLIMNQSLTKGNHYFTNYHKENQPKPWFSRLSFPRYHITTINRIRSNHYNLAASLFRKNMSNSPTCSCGANEDINHIIWDCPNYTAQRYLLTGQLRRKYERHKKPLPQTIEEILQNPTSSPAKFITDYLKKCQLFI